MRQLIRLGGVELNPSMNWADRFQSYQVAQSVNRTVGGRAIVFATPLRAGRKITLESTQDSGWIQADVLEILMGMAAIVGATFLLEIGSELLSGEVLPVGAPPVKLETYTVIFRHNEPPAIEINPHVPRPTHEATDTFFGKIKLLTI